MASYTLVSNFNKLEKIHLFSETEGVTEIYNGTNQENKYKYTDALYPLITLGFSQVLFKVISAIYEYKIEDNLSINLSTESFEIKKCFLIVSDNSTIDSMEGDDYFIVLVIQSSESASQKNIKFSEIFNAHFNNKAVNEEELQNHFKKIDTTNMMPRKKIVLDFISQSSTSSDMEILLSHLSTQNPDIRFVEIPQKLLDEGFEKAVLLVSIVFSFYYYGFMIANRFSRKQAEISIDVNNSNFNMLSNTFIKHRIIIININRYFLTDNRSLNLDVAEFCDGLIDKFKLDKKYNRFVELLNSFEKLIEMITENKQVSSNKNMNTSLALVAFIGLPVSIVGLLYQMNSKAEILHKPLSSFYTETMSLTAIFLSTTPFFILAGYILYKYLKKEH